jgi:GDPmannose 4,6-dehydratase
VQTRLSQGYGAASRPNNGGDMMKRALITGITGQDGAYLAKFLLSKDYEVFGLFRRTSTPNTWRLLNLNIQDRVTLIPGDLTDMASLTHAILSTRPHEIYNLAAQSFVGTSFEQPLLTASVDGLGVVMLLESVKQIDREIKVYHASTSEIFGNFYRGAKKKEKIVSEDDIFWPASPYGASKLFSYHQVRIYREAYDMFAVNGILFNHESPLRGLEFVSRKIANAVARIKLGLQDKIELGNVEAKRDWGYAPEYVVAMWLMLQQDTPEDFVIATGASRSVKDFFKCACDCADLKWEDVISVSDRYKRPLDVNYLCGNAIKAKKILGWKAETRFDQLVELMVAQDLQRWQDYLKGKIFPWDALNDPHSY